MLALSFNHGKAEVCTRFIPCRAIAIRGFQTSSSHYRAFHANFFFYTFCSQGWEGPLSAPRFYFMFNSFRMPDAKIKGLLEIALSLKKALSNIYYNNLSNELHTLVSSIIQMFMYKILIICEFDYKNF